MSKYEARRSRDHLSKSDVCTWNFKLRLAGGKKQGPWPTQPNKDPSIQPSISQAPKFVYSFLQSVTL